MVEGVDEGEHEVVVDVGVHPGDEQLEAGGVVADGSRVGQYPRRRDLPVLLATVEGHEVVVGEPVEQTRHPRGITEPVAAETPVDGTGHVQVAVEEDGPAVVGCLPDGQLGSHPLHRGILDPRFHGVTLAQSRRDCQRAARTDRMVTIWQNCRP